MTPLEKTIENTAIAPATASSNEYGNSMAAREFFKKKLCV